MTKKINHIAIVFSGGFSRGAAQLAFAQEIIKKIGYDKIKVLTGSSVGAINAYAVSSKSIRQMINCYRDFDCESLLRFKHLVSHDLYDHIFSQIERNKLYVPTYVTTTKLTSLTPSYYCLNSMKRNDIKKILNCSMAFPLINGPQRFKHHIYFDGGSTDNFPIYPLHYFNVDLIIILHCYHKYYPPMQLFQDNRIIVDADVTLKLPEDKTPFSFTKEDMELMIKEGKKAGEEFAKFIFKDFTFDGVKKRSRAYINQNLPERKKKSGGMMAVVEFLNFLYKFKENN